MKSELFLCACNGEGISVEKDNDEIYMSLWQRGLKPRGMTFESKIRYILALLKGSPFGDEVVLKNETARQLGEYLLSISNEPIVNMTTSTDSEHCETYISCPECGTFNQSDIKLCGNCGEEL